MTKAWPGKWLKTLQIIAVCACAAAPCAAAGGPDAKGVQNALKEANYSAHASHAAQNAAVQITVEWEKPVYFEGPRYFRGGRKVRTLLRVDRKSAACKGVLLAGGKEVVALASCVHAPDGFDMKHITLRFANGKTGTGAKGAVSVQDQLAYVRVSQGLTRGLTGLEAAFAPDGKSLNDVYGPEFSSALANHFIAHGVTSSRARRMTGQKHSLKPGDPFIFRGKLVALFKEAPSKFPVSFFGKVSEAALAVLRR